MTSGPWRLPPSALPDTPTGAFNTTVPLSTPGRSVLHESLRLAGEKITRDRIIEIRHPCGGEFVATVPNATVDDTRRALGMARGYSGR